MIRVAICCQDRANRTRLRKAVGRCARDAHVDNVETKGFDTLEAFRAVEAGMRPGFTDCAIVCLDDFPDGARGAQATNALQELRSAFPSLQLGLVSAEEAGAALAYVLGVGFCLLSGTYEQFMAMTVPVLRDIARQKGTYVTVRSSSGVYNVVLEDFQFAESTKRGPIIHLSRGQTVPVRGTLQSLYGALTSMPDERIAPGSAGRFVMAGSSCIVNLDNVRSVGEGSLIFSDGETIVVPIRKRKAVQDAWFAFRTCG